MKKIISMILAVLMLASLSLAVSANSDGNNWGDIPMFKGEIKLDGEKDDIYDMGFTVDIKNRTDGKTGGATGLAYMLWGNNKFYVFVEVKDADIVKLDPARSTWQNEGVEFTLDFGNAGANRSKTTVTMEDSKSSVSGDATEKMFTVKCKQTSTGYNAEIICDLSAQNIQAAKAGAKYGINLLINDMTGKDTRGIIRTVHKNNPTENENKKFDYITLSGDEVELAVEEKAPAAATKAPATADLTAIAVIALISAGGAYVSKKRK